MTLYLQSFGAYPSKLKISKKVSHSLYLMMNVMLPIIDRYLYCYNAVNFDRIFEKVMYNRMKDMLNVWWYGFRKAHGAPRAMNGTVKAIQIHMDQRLFTCGIFVELQKAFDSGNHKILLQLMREMSHWVCLLTYLRHVTLSIMISYLLI